MRLKGGCSSFWFPCIPGCRPLRPGDGMALVDGFGLRVLLLALVYCWVLRFVAFLGHVAWLNFIPCTTSGTTPH